MIQRIQTIFLLIVSIATSLVMWRPLVNYAENSSSYQLFASGLKSLNGDASISTLPLFSLLAIALILAVVSIFLYKKRMLQIRFSVFGLVLQLGFYALLYYMHYQISSDGGMDFQRVNLTVALPLVNAILLFLAIRAIGKDEALIRSLDRIR